MLAFSTILILSAAMAAPGENDYPGWRGLDRTGVAKDTGLLKSWPKEGPPKLWTATGLGGGYSTPSVAGGKVFGMGYLNDEEVVWAVDASNGDKLWTVVIGPKGKAGYNEGPRSTPTIDGDRLFTLGIGGDLVAMDVNDGKILWRKSFKSDFAGKMMSGWGYSESVLVDGDHVICTPGGDMSTLVALNKADGKLVWASNISNGGGAGYASLVIAKVGDTKMYITWLRSALVGVDAKSGKLLWRYEKTRNGTANIPTVIVKDNLVFCSTGYGDGGTALLDLSETDNGVTATEIYYIAGKTLQNHHGGMVLIGDTVYMGRGHNMGFPTAVDLKTGKMPWDADERGPGSGSAAVTAADGMLYFRYQKGTIALIEANPKQYKLISSFTLPKNSHPSWPHPVIANGKLFIREQDNMYCYDLKAK